MKPKQKKAFTLVELLVVISIIGMLMALLLPAVQMAREAGRRGVCMNNQKNVSFALLNYASGKGQLPGFLNRIGSYVPSGGTRTNCYGGWPTVILPLIERVDLWESASQGGLFDVTTNDPKDTTIDVFVCPSNPDAGSVEGALCYRVNAGRSGTITNPNDVPPVDHPYFGLFDLYKVPVDAATPATIASNATAIDSIKDGTSLTLLLSEGISPDTTSMARWSDGYEYIDTAPTGFFATGRIYKTTSDQTNKNDLERRLGFTVPYDFDNVGINLDKLDTTGTAPTGNPASHHPGILVVSFCDGHQATLAEDIDKITYLKLVSPSDRKAQTYATSDSNNILKPFDKTDIYDKFLDEGDF